MWAAAPLTSAGQLGLNKLIVTVTEPSAGATVSGTTTIRASVEIVGTLTVQGVQFKVDGVNVGAEDTSSPYSVAWNTRTASNGSHTITAVARDLLGVQWTSDPVTVTVFNDLTPPVVSLTAPAAGSTVRGTVTVSASASDNVGVTGVQFRLDGANLGAEDTVAPYTIAWNTLAASSGPHTLTAVARDAAGNTTTSAARTVTVDNTAPSVAMTAPASGALVSGTVTLTASASDNITVAGVQFFVDGAPHGAEDTSAPYSTAWNTTMAAGGSHTLTARARDAAGNTTTSGGVTVTVDNAAPSVAVTAPASGAIVSGTVTLTANASDNIAVAGVQFFVDGAPHGAEDTSAPYSTAWNTTAAAGGSHTLTARARDTAGNTTTSGAVTVTVDNAAPSVSITAPAAGSNVSGTITVKAAASDDVGVTGVQFQLDGVVLGAEDTSPPYEVAWNTTTASEGSHTLTAVARDAAGHSTPSTAVTVTVDNAVPTVTTHKAAGQPDPTDVSPINFEVRFSEPVSGFTAEDVRIVGTAGGTKTAVVSGGPATYNVAVSGMTTDGTVSVTVPAGSAHDGDGNANEASVFVARVRWDAVAPAVTVNQANSQADPTSDARIDFTVVFSEEVVGFGPEDVTIGGTAGGNKTADVSDGAFAPGMGHNFNVAVMGMTTDGTVIVTIAAGGAVDAAGKANTASTSTDNTVTYSAADTTPPTVTITSPSDGAAVSGTSSVTASAADGVGVAGVQFRLDGANLGAEDTEAPYTVSWDTLTASNGPHTLTAVARDAAGNVTTSAAVTVTVDNAAPSISMTAPAAGSTVSGTTQLSADASDNAAVVGVQFLVDGVPLGAEDTSAPYATAWDTTTAANGSHSVTARARDAAGNSTTTAPTTVTVANGGGGGTTLRIEDSDSAVAYSGGWNTGNTARAWSGGTAALGFAEGHNATLDFRGTGVRWVSFLAPYAGIANVYLDGVLAGTVDLYAPEETVLATVFTASGLTAGSHTLRIEVTRTKNAASGDYIIIIDAFDVIDPVPDTQAPTITITEPAGGEIVFGTLPITASASDDVGVSGVTFFVDGVALGSMDSIRPYSVNWTTTSVPDGDHTLTAIARDAAGNTTTSAPVTVTVSNASPPATATATRIENTDLAVTYVDGCSTCGQSPSWFHGSRSRPWSGGTASFNRADGGRATLTFSGTAVSWISFRASWAGIARVLVDGAFVREIDLYSPTEEALAQVFEVTNLAPGTHTIAVEATGRKNPDAADYAVVVDAFDVSPAVPPAVDGTRVEETAGSATFTAGWTQGDATRAWSGGTAAVSDTAGARATLVFTGTAVDWVAVRSPEMGIARVYLDGGFHAEVDLYARRSHQGIVFGATGLMPGQHRLEIEVAGARNASATGQRVAVDAFDVRSRVEDNDVAITYSGAWGFNDTARNWSGTSLTAGSGTAARSETAGASAEVAFTGTAVRWIGIRAPWVGIADVYLDGTFAERIDPYAPAEQLQAPLFTVSDLAAGPHTLRIQVAGEKNPASTTARVLIDAFDITVMPAPAVTRVQEADAAVGYTPEWTASGADFWSGRSARQAVAVGAQATFTFTGTAVRWIGDRGFSTGVARVSLDGQFIAQIDTRSALQEEYQTPLFTRTGLAPGPHTLTIELIGRTGEAPGTPVERIVIDAFDIQ